MNTKFDRLLADAFKKMAGNQLQQADSLCQTILQQSPTHAGALHLKGLIAHQSGDIQAAIDFVKRATDAAPSQPLFHYNLGGLLKAAGQFQLAATSYERAFALQPDAETLCNLGVVLRAMGRVHDAMNCYRRALELKPDFADALNNLGNAFLDLDSLPEALDSFRQALQARPQFPEALNSMGAVFKKRRQLVDAIACFRQALALRPSFIEAAVNLGSSLLESGHFEEALHYFRALLRISNNRQAQIGFAHCAKHVSTSSFDTELQVFLIRAIDEAWIRPSELWQPALALVRQDLVVVDCIRRSVNAWPSQLGLADLFGPGGLQVIARNPVLRCLLRNMPVMDIEVERFLVMCRGILLNHVVSELSGDTSFHASAFADSDALEFFSDLASQCFINEYVFPLSATDAGQMEELHHKLISQLRAEEPVSSLGIIAFAAHSPLSSLGLGDSMLALSWPSPVARLVKQQLKEPAEERQYALSMPQVTPLSGGVSSAVRLLYEENPYPRWINAPRETPFGNVEAYFKSFFPDAGFVRPDFSGDVQILIAGCGTGQHPIQTATTFPFAKILAVDLSVASLSYAQRKTKEMALTNIDFAQADILHAAGLQRTFHIIESVGVLHHLADPMAGWRELVALLKPNALMRLGFYSAIARRTIVSARRYISLQGYSSDVLGIRQCRQDVMSAHNVGEFGSLQFAGDFFTTSGCRDLLFHVQEHCFSLFQIKASLEELGLSFLGFTLDEAVKNRYRTQFPDDLAMVDLDNWNQFENDHPDTFANMYQFWVQKAS